MFPLPSPIDPGARLTHAGAVDHLVGEAVRLDDPEGKGIEVHADRPASTGRWQDGPVVMSNARVCTVPRERSGEIGQAGDRRHHTAGDGIAAPVDRTSEPLGAAIRKAIAARSKIDRQD